MPVDAAGAAGGATAAALSSNEPEPTYQRFVEKCLGDEGFDLVVDPRHRGEEPGKPAPVLVAAGAPAAERGGVVVDEVVGDVGGDLLGISAVERGEIGPNDPGRA